MIIGYFILSFIGLVFLVTGITMLYWKLSLVLKSNIIKRQNKIFTIIRFYHLEKEPDLLENPELQQLGSWEYSPEGHYWKGYAKISKEVLRAKLMTDYQLSPAQVIVTVPEEMKMASAQCFDADKRAWDKIILSHKKS